MARVYTDGTAGEIEELDPRIAAQVAWIVTEARRAGWPVEIRRLGGRRTTQEQRKLYAQGRTTPGPIVTNVQISKHNSGLAVDFDLIGYERSVGMPLWRFLGSLWRQAGGRWGGDWGDYGHFEL